MAAEPRKPQKLLLLDDDREFLEIYGDLLAQLPSKPEIHTADTGPRAIAILESEPFSLLVSDLRMAKMDGLQVLAIVRRKFPTLRTVVITGLADESFRARAYALGVDLFLQKPRTPEENKLFLDCLESLLGSEAQGGFRGIQSKMLVDIIQLECLSQSSSVLKVVQGVQEGRIWFLNGEITDAQTADLSGEAAFHRILSWKTGNFEIMPAEPDHPRAIHNSYQGLLLETVQALDEARSVVPPRPPEPGAAPPKDVPKGRLLPELARFRGVEFLLSTDNQGKVESWGVENAEQFGQWTKHTMERFRKLGEDWQLGRLNRVHGMGLQRQVIMVEMAGADLCVGMQSLLSAEQVRQTLKNILAKWVS
jgi:CheY-like chemotaxis protein